MKIAIQCQSPLLQRSLEIFLKDYLASVRVSDIIIRDKNVIDSEKLTFIIGNFDDSDLIKPFTKAQLLYSLEKKYQNKDEPIKRHTHDTKEIDFSILERHIERLTSEYQANIIKAIKTFYEK